MDTGDNIPRKNLSLAHARRGVGGVGFADCVRASGAHNPFRLAL